MKSILVRDEFSPTVCDEKGFEKYKICAKWELPNIPMITPTL